MTKKCPQSMPGKFFLMVCLTVLFLLLASVSAFCEENAPAEKTGGGRFEWINDNAQAFYYFDKDSFRLTRDPYFEEKYVDVWIRTQFMPEGAWAEENLRRLNDLPAGAYRNLSYRMAHYWFRQQERQYYLLAFIDYDADGTEINKQEYKYSPAGWKAVVPDTFYDAWRAKLLEYLDLQRKNKKKEFK